MVYKSMNSKAPPYMSEMLTRNSQDATRQQRNTNTDLRLPKKRTCNGQKSFSFRGAKLWNSLNTEAKLATSLNRFKIFDLKMSVLILYMFDIPDFQYVYDL